MTLHFAMVDVATDSSEWCYLLQRHYHAHVAYIACVPYLVAVCEILCISGVYAGMCVAQQSYTFHLCFALNGRIKKCRSIYRDTSAPISY